MPKGKEVVLTGYYSLNIFPIEELQQNYIPVPFANEYAEKTAHEILLSFSGTTSFKKVLKTTDLPSH